MDRKTILAKIKQFGIDGRNGNIQKINDIAEVLEIVQTAKEDTEADILLAAVRSLTLIFQGHLQRDQGQWLVAPASSAGETAKSKVDAWLRDKYSAALSLMSKLVAHPETPLAWCALNGVMGLCKAELATVGHAVRREILGDVFSGLVGQLVLSKDKPDAELLRRFLANYANAYADAYYRTLKGLTRCITAALAPSRTDGDFAASGLSPQQVAANVHAILAGIQPIQKGQTLPYFFTPGQASSVPAKKPRSAASRPPSAVSTSSQSSSSQKSKVVGKQLDSKQLRRTLDSTWMLFLRLPMHHALLKTLLLEVDKSIFPFILRPVLLMDFLADAYNQGGMLSLLSLSGLFVLMTRHNLDYPHFYPKLYSLLTPDVFYLSFRDQVFSYTARFLSSTHLPAYLVASFIKKLCAIAVLAPPAGILASLALVFNLLQRHPQCGVLINRTALGKSQPPPSASQAADGDEQLLLLDLDVQASDPYLPDELDPAKSRAIDSSLWELELLEQHYCSSVSKFVQIFKKPYDPKASLFTLHDFSSLTYDILITRDTSKRLTSVPTEFENRSTLFPSGSIFDTLWEF